MSHGISQGGLPTLRRSYGSWRRVSAFPRSSRGPVMTWQDQYQQEGRSAAELFQRYIVPRITSLWGKDLVDRARIRVGENVLDVACGTPS
jgi:hypothetical protein